MKKHLPSRILGLAALYCAVFFVLVVVQFSGRGNFTISANTMILKGRYLEDADDKDADNESPARLLAGGVRVFFGGLEFNLKNDRGSGLLITVGDGAVFPVNPESLTVTENAARLMLPGGGIIVFNSAGSSREPELQIYAEFTGDISEISVPIIPRRSLVRNNGQIGIMYNGNRYMFNGSGQELETNKIVLSRENSFVSYRSRGRQRSFDPSDFIIPQSQNYYYAVSNWQEQSYARWNQTASSLQNEDDITGYMSEALRQNSYAAALSSISGGFVSGQRHSYRSSVYLGGMIDAYRSFVSEEDKKSNMIYALIRESSLDVLKEEHVIDWLLTRGSTVLANDVIQLIQNTSKDKLIIDYCPGLLEAYADIKNWNPSIKNPVEPLAEQILLLVSENMSKDSAANLVYASSSKERDLYFSVRLGTALISWAEDFNNIEWADIGRSLVLSALTGAGPGAGNLYGGLKSSEYYPKATGLADNGLWVWTASPSVRSSWADGNLNLSFSFPVSMTHHVIISGIKPFIKLQIHEMDWRTDSHFEQYDSSGWVYYPQEQILVLKLRHRQQTEKVTIVYRFQEPAPVVEEETNNTEGEDYFGW